MKNLEIVKMIFGYILIGYSIIGIYVALSYQFNLDLVAYDWKTFGSDGGASNSPNFYGLMAVAGSILLANVKKEN